MRAPVRLRTLPGRLVTGAYILHTGWEKRNAAPERAAALHRSAANAYPVLESFRPATFVKLLSAAEMATGAILLAPFVDNRVAGAALTAFSGSLLVMYWRTPAMHRPGSVWPTPAGIAVSKDVWMLGIGLGLLVDGGSGSRPPDGRL